MKKLFQQASLMVAIGFLNVLFAGTVGAGGPGTTGADVLKATLGARPTALGGAYGAVGGDVESLHFNPAAPASQTGANAVFLHFLSLEEVTYEMIGYGQPTADWGVVSGTFAWRTMPSIDNPGAPDAPVQANDAVVTVGTSRWAKELAPEWDLPLDGLAVGAAGKLIYSSLREAHAVSGALDLGLRWSGRAFALPLAFGAALQNLGPPLRFIEQGDPLPLTGRVSAAVFPALNADHKGLVSAEWVTVADTQSRFSLGAEYALRETLFFRAGHTWTGRENLSGPAAGLGVAFGAGGFRAHLDYTYRPLLWSGWDSVASSHLFSLGASF